MEKDVFILKALLAQQGSRHFEMAGEVIDAIRRYGVDIKKMLRSLLIESYANVMSELKLTLTELLQHQNGGVQNANQVQTNVYNIIEVSDTIEAYSGAVLHLVGQYLLTIADLDNESRIVYLNLRGDCFRNLAEILIEKQNGIILYSAILAYTRAYDIATESMDASNPITLQVALTYSSFANDLLDDTESAYQIASVAFSKAQAELNKNTPEILQQNALLRKLYDNVIQWTKILSFQNTDFILKFNPTFLKFEQIKRSEFVEKAMLSRDMKRYNTMAATMKNLIKATNTANLQEGKLFSEAFQKLVDERKLSLRKVAQDQTLSNLTEHQKYKTKILYTLNISKELQTLCNTVLSLISEHILNNELIDEDTKIFFLNMKSKYFKYISEVSKSAKLEFNLRYGNNAAKAYILAQSSMQPTSDIRLEATLNFAIFVADNTNEPGTAYEICNTELIELGIHEKEVEDLNIVPKMHYYVNIWNMKQQKKFSSLCELPTKEYIKFKYLDLASIAESSKRYLDMAVALKNLIDVNRRLDFDERDMFNRAFKKLVDERRHSLRKIRDTENVVTVVESKKVEKDKLKLNITAQEYRNKIKDELEFLCWYTIHLLNILLSIDDIGNYSKLYYLRMKGDFYRYLTEIGNTTRHDTIRNALNAYKDAYEIAMSTSPADAYRLELMVNYAAFLYDIMDNKRYAASMLRQALCDIGNKEIKDSSVSDIIENINRNLSRWFTAAIQPQKGSLQHKELPKKNDLQQKMDVLQSNAQQKQKDNAQKKDNEPQKGNFQEETIVRPTNYFPEKKNMSQEASVSQTDNMTEKSTVSQQDLPGKTMVPQKDKFPAKSSASRTDNNLSKKNSVSQQDFPRKTMVSQKDKFLEKNSESQTDNLLKNNTVPQAGIFQENANGPVNRNIPEKDETKLKEKPCVKPPKEIKKKKQTKKKETAHKK